MPRRKAVPTHRPRAATAEEHGADHAQWWLVSLGAMGKQALVAQRCAVASTAQRSQRSARAALAATLHRLPSAKQLAPLSTQAAMLVSYRPLGIFGSNKLL